MHMAAALNTSNGWREIIIRFRYKLPLMPEVYCSHFIIRHVIDLEDDKPNRANISFYLPQ